MRSRESVLEPIPDPRLSNSGKGWKPFDLLFEDMSFNFDLLLPF